MGTYDILNPPRFFGDFPSLPKDIDPSSPWTSIYNCIAHAMGFQHHWWWPLGKDAYWPGGCPRETTIAAFEHAFATQGYKPCFNGDLEESFDKVALYALGDVPTHAAKQLTDVRWWSKCGGNVDIEHELQGLEGPCYGKVVKFFRRPKEAS